MKRLLVVFIAVVAGCSTSSGVIPFGKDTFTVTVSAEGGLARAKKEALVQANEYCAGKGLVMMPVSQDGTEKFSPGWVSDNQGTYDLVFRCLTEEDADYQRTQIDRPDVIIENR